MTTKIIPKGQSLPDGTYLYKCPCYVNPCNLCFDGNETAIINSLKTAKGQRYHGNLKAYLTIKGQAIISTAKSIKEKNNGKFTMTNITQLADTLGFPRKQIKSLIEYLEECGFIKTGTYDKLKISINWQPTKM
ncbi:hypothetical protein [uncultured phage]|nr:hypothetical protein [uncultured phage]